MTNIINNLFAKFNFGIVKIFPRHSTRFARMIFGNEPIIAIEIGTDKGRNALSILKTLNIKKIYLVDPYEDYEGRSKEEMSFAEIEAKKRLEKYKHKIIWIKKFSKDAIKDIPGEIDFIYIDGDHEDVKSDIENYYPKLKVGGILAGHDITNPKYRKGIIKSLIDFSFQNNLLFEVSRTDWWIVKSPFTLEHSERLISEEAIKNYFEN